MKTNAIIRIVLFSLAIVVLLGILLAGIGGRMYMFAGKDSSSASTPDFLTGVGIEAARIREIEIEWVAGDIELTAVQDTNMITFSESQVSDPDDQLVYRFDGDKLSIQYCKDSIKFPSFGIHTETKKNLSIMVPQDWICESLEIDAASANLTVKNLAVNEVDFDGASGFCVFEDCIVKDIRMDTASGDIRFKGNLDNLDVNAASADCVIEVRNVPERIDMDTMSGDLDITLPEYCGFTVSMDAMSSDFSSDFQTTTSNGNHIHGDGSCHIQVDAMSGDVTIRKGLEAAYGFACTDPACTVASHHHTDHHN